MLAGDSAGGNLAASAILKIREEGLPTPGGLFLISPWLDLTLSGDSYDVRASQDPILTREAMRDVVPLYLGQIDGKSPYVFPCIRGPIRVPPLS